MTRGSELDAVRQKGKRVRTEHLEVRALASLLPLEGPAGPERPGPPVVRVGIVVPRHRHSAVDRNRLKRRLRELVRTRLIPALDGLGGDLVIRARAEAYDDSFEALGRQLERAARDLRRILTSPPPA